MSEDSYLKCNCKSCGNPIEFPASATGTEVECPHCGQRTELKGGNGAGKSKLPLLAVVGGCIVLAVTVVAFLFFKSRSKDTFEQAPPVQVVVAPTNLPPTNVAPTKPAVPQKREKSIDDLKVGAVQLEKAKVGNLVYAVGTVTNASEFQRFGVKIELILYNKDGKKLAVTSDYKDIIEPNREWQFRAMVLDSKTTSAKVSSITEE